MLPRLQLFEFNDEAWTPTLLRQTIVESLSLALDQAQVLRPLVKPFLRFLEQSKAATLVDLAAGAGGPAGILLRELQAAGVAVPRFVLTDLYPALEPWRALQARFPGVVDFIDEPVDVTSIPPSLTGARVIINALHHFPPRLAQRALLGACEGASGLFVAECLVRNPLSFAAMAPAGLVALMGAPIRARKHQLALAAMTWLTPIALAASVWDGTVSTFRCYSQVELQKMLEPLNESWVWSFGEFTYNALGRGTWFSGVPRTRST